jgi:hypothetical protein
MVTVLTTAVGLMVGLFNISSSENVHHYQRPVVERSVTATNREPRLFMVVPESRAGSPAKDVEANSVAPPTEKADVKKAKPHKPKMLAHQRDNNEGRGYGNALGYAEETQYGPKRLFSNW